MITLAIITLLYRVWTFLAKRKRMKQLNVRFPGTYFKSFGNPQKGNDEDI